jgi:hypothetical protein
MPLYRGKTAMSQIDELAFQRRHSLNGGSRRSAGVTTNYRQRDNDQRRRPTPFDNNDHASVAEQRRSRNTSSDDIAMNSKLRGSQL